MIKESKPVYKYLCLLGGILCVTIFMFSCKKAEKNHTLEQGIPKDQVNFQLPSEKDRKEINSILPKPDSLFHALSKLNIEWKGLVEVNSETGYKSEAQIALNLGSRSADGLVMVYAEHGADDIAKNVTAINDLARRLTIGDEVKSRLGEVEKGIKQKDSKMLRYAISDAHSAAEKALKDKQNNHLAVLISCGGWIEGLYLVTKSQSKNYNADAAELLRQPELADNFSKILSTLPKPIKNDQSVANIINKIPEIKKLTDFPPEATVPQENIVKLFEISKGLKKSIEEKR